MKPLLLTLILTLFCSTAYAEPMTQDEMEKIISSRVNVEEQTKGQIIFTYKKIKMAVISDVKHDRMRIIAPITEYAKLTTEQKDTIMEANFHKTLDARYASSNGILYSAFIHPMSVLSETQIGNALDQVATLAATFGTTYSSGELSFGGEK